MAFILLLTLGLATLSQVGTRSSALSLNTEKARCNARLALMVAIGDLQKAAGPDQRVTATANIAAGPDGSRIDPGEAPQNNINFDGSAKQLSPVLPGTRYWTGVFMNQDAPEQIYQKTPAVGLLRWLVSRMDDSSPTPADDSYRVGPDGNVLDTSKAILLVGPNSVGTGPAAVERYVAAPRVPVSGASAMGGHQSGAFAYWIGDEGVKARVNMVQNDLDSDYASLVAQRRAWEAIDGFDNYPLPGSDQSLAKVFSLPALAVSVPDISPASLASIFHSATNYSRGLLVNTLEGGTRVDLTALLSGSLSSDEPAFSFDNYPLSGSRVIEESAFPGLQHLKWDHVRDFYQKGINSDGALQVESAETATNTIAPTITDLRLLFGVRLSDAVMEPDSTDNYKAEVHLVVKIAVTLSNPYSVAMEWDQPLELEIKNNRRPGGGVPLTVYSTRQEGERREGAIAAFETIENGTVISTDTHYLPIALDESERNPASRAAVLNRALFRIPAGRLEPGEAIAYSHAGNRNRRNTDTPFGAFTVDMEPIDLTLLEYSKSLEMTIGRYEFPRNGLQIRAGETSRAVVELRESDSGGLLRKIEDLELNNPYRRDTVSREFDVAKVFDDDGNQRFNGAVPLLLYRFQFSQPGEQYEGYGTFEMGLLGSTLRTFTDFNVRSTNFHNPVKSYNPPPLFMEIIDSKSDLDWYADVGGETGTAFTQNFIYNLPGQFWGYNQTNGTRQVVLFSFPDQFTSLAQLQHADMTQDADTRSVGHQPGNAFGNSYASPFVQRNLTIQTRTDFDLKPFENDLQIPRNYYDISYILNSAIWDRYFFSSLSSGSGAPENSTLVPIPGVSDATLQDPNLAATGLLIDGAFNVNSTEKAAWKAFLGSSKHFRHPADDGSADDAPADEAAFSRSLEQPETYQAAPSGKDEDSYAGYRRITDSQLDDLAEEMVRQVRLRGPFVSRSHFVNRVLALITEEPELSRSGALQTALDESGINMNIDGDRNAFSELETATDRVRLQADGGDYALDIPNSSNTDVYDWVDLGVASILADAEMLDGNSLAEEQGYRSTGIPGWITQADLLQVIGPSISARSDTFRIRTAGQAIGSSGKVEATAYLEALIQRMPEYVDPSNVANERDTIDTANLTPTNEQYGRRFKIVSFRWLSPDEI